MKYNIGDKVIVIKNRLSRYGKCSDIIELENKVVTISEVIFDTDNSYKYTINNGNSVCKACNIKLYKKKENQIQRLYNNIKALQSLNILDKVFKTFANKNSNLNNIQKLNDIIDKKISYYEK